VNHLDEDDQPRSHGRGDLLVLELLHQPTGRLLGAPASVTRRDAANQTVLGEAPEILFGNGGERIRLRSPTGVVRFVLGNRKGALAMFGTESGSTVMTCNGIVDADDREIRFGGWVEVRSLLADGSEDVGGFHLDAERMRMKRNPETGEVERVFATTGARLRWRRIVAVAEDMTVDLLTNTCTIVDHLAAAQVRMPTGLWASCRRAEFNYLTYDAKAWHTLVAADRTRK